MIFTKNIFLSTIILSNTIISRILVLHLCHIRIIKMKQECSHIKGFYKREMQINMLKP